MLPTTQEYKISLMIGQDSFRTLEGVEVIPNPNYPDEPWYSTGGLAIVFKLKLKDKLYALKCFYTEANERQERLGLIAAYLKQNPSPYFVDFTYLENELWVETDNDEGQGYPVVLMEWVEGKTLDNYLEQICTQNNTPALKNLYFQFCNLAWWLQQQPIAHGDIKHDNLIVTPDGKLKLIDYDGVFVPALRGRKANEMGSPCYQHPKRDAYFFEKNLDDFSLLVLQITLLALQQQPKFFKEYYNGDGIMLKDTDYQNFAQSPIKTILWQLPEVKIPLLLSQLQGNLNNLSAIDLMPLLQDVAWINWLVDGQKDGKLEFERQRLKELVLGDERWRELFIDTIANKYSLSESLIEKFENRWKCYFLCHNESNLWSEELIDKYIDKDKWVVEFFSENKALPWSIELIEKYKDKWDWGKICRNIGIPWSVEIIEKYKDKLLTNRYVYGSQSEVQTLSANESLPWTIELIEKFQDKWNWIWLSANKVLPWSVELIDKYENKWNWKGYNSLSYNESLPWSIELIEKYKDKWDWDLLSNNSGIPWSIEIIQEYRDKWDWDMLSNNSGIPWSIEIIETFKRNGRGVGGNNSINFTTEMFEKYENQWSWAYDSMNTNTTLPWSIDFIEKYKGKSRFNWNALSYNKSLPWSKELIEKYEDKWSWRKYNGLSYNSALPWSFELIEKYKNKWEWDALSYNTGLPWSIELIEKYNYAWSWDRLKYHNPLIYEKVFQPLLNDDFIDEVMAEI